jgi:hypothetical protein
MEDLWPGLRAVRGDVILERSHRVPHPRTGVPEPFFSHNVITSKDSVLFARERERIPYGAKGFVACRGSRDAPAADPEVRGGPRRDYSVSERLGILEDPKSQATG